MRYGRITRLFGGALLGACAAVGVRAQFNPDPPPATVKLVFIHHSTGENWLSDDNDNAGRLGLALRDNNYFVSDTNYGWGPDSIGDRTDIGNWWEWFRGGDAATYLSALYAESGQHCSYSRLAQDPGGENEIVLFKSCFPNSNLGGSSDDPIPVIGDNPLRGQDSSSEYHTVANAKGIYIDLLEYFRTRPDKLFIVVCAPPLQASDTSPHAAANARAFNDWLSGEYLATYEQKNVFVFDFYNVLTSNGGNPGVNDLGAEGGNHHRFRGGQVEHVENTPCDTSAYPSGDSHPTSAGGQKASGEFPALLNVAYHCWKGEGDCPQTSACVVTCAASGPSVAGEGEPVGFTGSATASNACAQSLAYDWDFGDGGAHSDEQNPSHAYAAAGSYTWIMTASAGGATCARSGLIRVHGAAPPPEVTSVTKAGNPFRLNLTGANFDPGLQVFVGEDAEAWANVRVKSARSLVIKGGGALKARFPKGVAVALRVVNPDGQSDGVTYTR
jgi:hypothetical protein